MTGFQAGEQESEVVESQKANSGYDGFMSLIGERDSLPSLVARYEDLQARLMQGLLIMRLGLACSEDFPRNLPGSISDRLRTASEELVTAHVEGRPLPRYSGADAALGLTLVEMLRAARLGRDVHEVELRRIVLEQAFLIQYAHLDAFLSDALAIACVARPELMRSKNTIELEEVLSSSNWDDLIRRIADRHVFKFGFQSLRDRVTHLRDKHAFPLIMPPDVESDLIFGEAVRNVVVHAGSVVTAEFLRVTKSTSYRLGDRVTLSERHVEEVSRGINLLSRALTRDIAAKVLGASGDVLAEIPARHGDDNQPPGTQLT